MTLADPSPPSKLTFLALESVALLAAATPWLSYRAHMAGEGGSGDSMMAAGLFALEIHGTIVVLASLAAAVAAFPAVAKESVGTQLLFSVVGLFAGPALLWLVVVLLGW